MIKRFLCLVFTLAAFGLGYYYLARDATAPLRVEFELDLVEIRRLAGAVPGPRAQAIRFENVGSIRFTESMIVPGDRWQAADMEVYSYQVVFPDGTIIIDAAMADDGGLPGFLLPRFDSAAFERVVRGLGGADQIVITHEHFDHIGGLAMHPNLAALLPALRLTRTQLDHADRMAPAKWPIGVMADYRPLEYQGLHALAPGVVLIQAPGHTPGSQMIFVQLADGRELLFLGDVAWKMRSVDLQRERPRFMTLLIREDRKAVFGQLQALHELRFLAPALRLVPGHDGPVNEKLAAEGWLVPGFLL